MNKAERNDILDQHRQVYDGFVTTYGQQINQQPLYIQDYANDKGGLTVNNKGEVKTYTNMRINESDAMTGAKYLPSVSFDFGGDSDEFESEYVGFDGKDRIADKSTDMKHGTFDDETEFELELDDDIIDDFEISDIDLTNFEDDIETDIEPLQEQLNKTLDMFKRFKKY
jgi:hypothetical protein